MTPSIARPAAPLKPYKLPHSNVQICAIQHVHGGLLTLEQYGFQEAAEYKNWLLKHKTEIWIGVKFDGKKELFVMEHWEQKMGVHLEKLREEWEKKGVTGVGDMKIVVKMLWDPKQGNGNTAGAVGAEMGKTVGGMLKTLCTIRGTGTESSKGELDAQAFLSQTAGLDTLVHSRAGLLGLDEFLSGEEEGKWKRVAKSVLAQFYDPVDISERRERRNKWEDSKSLIHFKGWEGVEWGCAAEGELVVRKVVEGEKVWRESEGYAFSPRAISGKLTHKRLWMSLFSACGSGGGINIVKAEGALEGKK